MQRNFIFKVAVQGEKREYKVNIPTVGELVHIEHLKAIYAESNYRGIASSNTIGGNYALDLVDMNAYLTTLVPDLIKDLKSDDLFKLDIFDVQDLKKAYEESFIPWVNEWQTALRKIKEGKKEEK